MNSRDISVGIITGNSSDEQAVDPVGQHRRRGKCYEKLVAVGPPLGNRCKVHRCGTSEIAASKLPTIHGNNVMSNSQLSRDMRRRSDLGGSRELPVINCDRVLRALPIGGGDRIHASGQEKPCRHPHLFQIVR
jgi:hypothetical protein